VAPADPIERFVISAHAILEMQHRGLSREAVERVLRNPEQRQMIRPVRVVLQARDYTQAAEKVYLVRVFVDVDREPPEVVTAYRTSKVEKYRKEPT